MAKEIKIFTPCLKAVETINIHPAIDFKDKAYFGVFLPVVEDNSDKFFIINSDREILSPYAENSNIRLKGEPIKYNKWSLSSMNDYKNSLSSIPPKDLFNEIVETLKFYLELPQEELYDFLALWIMGTYLFPMFKSYPYVYVGGIKQTGKTKTLQITSLMSFNSIFSTNISSSALFRLIESIRCSLFMDESEQLNAKWGNPERAKDIQDILNSGYKRSGKCFRSEKNKDGQFYVKDFEIYSPKMLANIYGLENILEDRCIRLIMKRTIIKQIGEREIDEENPLWQEIRDKLYVFVLDNWAEIKKLYDLIENQTSLSNRDYELWHGILTIAMFIDKAVYDRIILLAEQKTEEKHTENMTETAEYLLIQALVEVVEKKAGYIPCKEILYKLQEQFEEEQRWLNSKWLGRALIRLGFTDKRRVSGCAEYLLSVRAVNDIASRLGLISKQNTTNTINTTNATKSSSVCGVSSVSSVLFEDNKDNKNPTDIPLDNDKPSNDYSLDKELKKIEKTRNDKKSSGVIIETPEEKENWSKI